MAVDGEDGAVAASAEAGASVVEAEVLVGLVADRLEAEAPVEAGEERIDGSRF